MVGINVIDMSRSDITRWNSRPLDSSVSRHPRGLNMIENQESKIGWGNFQF